jgi:hypothetical protein
MLPKNILIFTTFNFDIMNTFLSKITLFATVLFCAIVFTKCTKSDSDTALDPIVFVDNNFVNKDLSVHLAVDNGTTVTTQYNGYTFRFTKNSATGGTVSVSNTLLNYSGTWSTSTDHTTITMALPTPPNEFAFLNRQWKFTKYSTPIMELAPNASGDSKVLHFQIQ